MIFLNEALSLAESVKGKVSPRPPVGAVIVKDAKIVGKGNTSISPLKHAEIMAIEQAGNMTKGSTMYTSLEPCSHHGSTTPCVKSIVQAGIKKVITPLKDILSISAVTPPLICLTFIETPFCSEKC